VSLILKRHAKKCDKTIPLGEACISYLVNREYPRVGGGGAKCFREFDHVRLPNPIYSDQSNDWVCLGSDDRTFDWLRQAVAPQLLTTSNFIGPSYHAALLFSGLGSIVLLFGVLFSQQIRARQEATRSAGISLPQVQSKLYSVFEGAFWATKLTQRNFPVFALFINSVNMALLYFFETTVDYHGITSKELNQLWLKHAGAVLKLCEQGVMKYAFKVHHLL